MLSLLSQLYANNHKSGSINNLIFFTDRSADLVNKCFPNIVNSTSSKCIWKTHGFLGTPKI